MNKFFRFLILVSVFLAFLAGGSRADSGHSDASLSTPSAMCGVCHQKEYNEWRFGAGSDLDSMGRGSYHSIASSDDVYGILLDMFDPVTQEFCNGCHIPANPWAVQDKVNDVPAARTVNTSEGINCVSCHFDGGRMVSKDELNDPVFCATCHNDDYPLTEAYAGWAEDYTGSYTCTDCHMRYNKMGHTFGGSHSPSVEAMTLDVRPSLPLPIQAGVPFTATVKIRNSGAGHSFPVCPLRDVIVKVSVLDESNAEISSYVEEYFKRTRLFGEDESLTNVLRAGEKRILQIPETIATPGVYTLKVEVFRDRNRLGILNSTTLLNGKYLTFTVN